MKDMIKGVESMSKLAESMAKASGWTIVYQHSYIDENGKYHCRMQMNILTLRSHRFIA